MNSSLKWERGTDPFLRLANYVVNTTNQYTSRDVPGYVDILGLALATNTVTVNSQSTYRHAEYFRKELGVNNSSAAVWTNITVSAPGETSVSGNVFVPKTTEVFGYDLDGNLTNDGRWAFTWDAENRLVQIESVSSNPTASKRRVAWEFDGKGRRIRQKTEDGSSGTYVVTEDLKFINDGWRCLVELNATNNVLVRRYGWGLDLSGSMDGAGGVGGLLWMRSGPAPQFCAYDGNGNVVGMVRGSTGDQTAAYEYDPFGRTIRMTGFFAQSNPFRFSTKRANDTSDLVLYEYRAYNPSSGRWLSRDPLGELAFRRDHSKEIARKNRGELNPYGFVRNSPFFYYDLLGLYGNPVSGPGGPVGPSSPYGPGGAYDDPNNSDDEGSFGLGFYFLFGADFSISVGTCCENGTQYRYIILTACGGLGGSFGIGKSKLEMEAPSGTGSSFSFGPKDSCPPQVRHYVAATASVGIVEAGAEFVDEGDAIEGVLKPTFPPSVGIKYAICSDTVISKKAIGCCARSVLPPITPPPFPLLPLSQ